MKDIDEKSWQEKYNEYTTRPKSKFCDAYQSVIDQNSDVKSSIIALRLSFSFSKSVYDFVCLNFLSSLNFESIFKRRDFSLSPTTVQQVRDERGSMCRECDVGSEHV